MLGAMMFKQTLWLSQVIGQVWREVVGCRNWPVMRVPQFIALRRNDHWVTKDMGAQVACVFECERLLYIIFFNGKGLRWIMNSKRHGVKCSTVHPLKLWMDKNFHHIFYEACDYLFSKKGSRGLFHDSIAVGTHHINQQIDDFTISKPMKLLSECNQGETSEPTGFQRA